MRDVKGRVEMFRAGHLPLGAPTRELVDDLWQRYERMVSELRKISVPANDVGSSCLRCGARWSEVRKEHHAPRLRAGGHRAIVAPELSPFTSARHRLRWRVLAP